jgi:hypothetical protein
MKSLGSTREKSIHKLNQDLSMIDMPVAELKIMLK